MNAQVLTHPALHLPERIEDKQREIRFLEADLRLQRALAEDAEGALEVARQELAAMEQQEQTARGARERTGNTR